jgi:hypothetical protein
MSIKDILLRVNRVERVIVPMFSVQIIEIKVHHVLILTILYVSGTINARRMADVIECLTAFTEKMSIGVPSVRLVISYIIVSVKRYRIDLILFAFHIFHVSVYWVCPYETYHEIQNIFRIAPALQRL